jgi:sporulation protein YlmC with PRC-barrel domain
MDNNMQQKNTTTIHHLEELLSKKIITAEGKRLGHIFDIQISRDGKHHVTALMYGENSLLYRLHVYEPLARAFHLNKPKTIPWEAVDHFDSSGLHLKPGYEGKRE